MEKTVDTNNVTSKLQELTNEELDQVDRFIRQLEEKSKQKTEVKRNEDST